MTLEVLQSILGWCTVINVSMLVFWFLFFALAHDFMYEFHRKLFNLTSEKFDAIHYSGMAMYKLFIVVFNISPYLAICFVA